MDLSRLDEIVQGQAERNILDNSITEYLSKMRTLTRTLYNHAMLRHLTLEHDEEGNALQHTGLAVRVYKLKLPMTLLNVKRLFGLISIDPSLSRQRGPVRAPPVDLEAEVVDANNPGAHLITCSAQTYQNYRSALKWWHVYHRDDMDKVGSPWPDGMNEALKNSTSTYKRDVAQKKRKGIMRIKEGKSPYNLNGYISLVSYFSMMKPSGQLITWSEGMFAALFTTLSVHSMGRSDNIDDMLIQTMGWENDAMTVRFGLTKSDQAGDTTAEVKRIYLLSQSLLTLRFLID